MTDDMRLAQLLDDQFTEQGSARNPFAPFAAGTDLNHLSLRGNFNLIEVAEAVHAAGWHPPAQVIETAEALDALPPESVVASTKGHAAWLHGGRGWVGRLGVYASGTVLSAAGGAVVLLWSPTEKAETK